MIVLIFLLAGMIFGYLLRKRKKVYKFTDKLLTWSIYLLLFLLGISVGSNSEIINNFHNIGFQAIIISLSGILGSLVISFLIYKFFFLKK